MIGSRKITLVDKQDLTISLEWNDQFAILHLPKLKLTKSSYTDFLVTVPQLYEFLSSLGYEAIYTAIEPESKTIAKLLDRLGAVKLGQDPNQKLDVYEYRGEK